MSGADERDHGRDDNERTFAALPPARGRGFAQTWWGQAWLKALEDTALDGEQLKRGRRQAREGAVGAVSVREARQFSTEGAQGIAPFGSNSASPGAAAGLAAFGNVSISAIAA